MARKNTGATEAVTVKRGRGGKSEANTRMRIMLRDNPDWSARDTLEVLVQNGLMPADDARAAKQMSRSFYKIRQKIYEESGRIPPGLKRGRGRPRNDSVGVSPAPSGKAKATAATGTAKPVATRKPTPAVAAAVAVPISPPAAAALRATVQESPRGADRDRPLDPLDSLLLVSRTTGEAQKLNEFDRFVRYAEVADKVGGVKSLNRCIDVLRQIRSQPTPAATNPAAAAPTNSPPRPAVKSPDRPAESRMPRQTLRPTPPPPVFSDETPPVETVTVVAPHAAPPARPEAFEKPHDSGDSDDGPETFPLSEARSETETHATA